VFSYKERKKRKRTKKKRKKENEKKKTLDYMNTLILEQKIKKTFVS